jgi:cytosine/adenosine deaminase-related metal-dependent hydrolase
MLLNNVTLINSDSSVDIAIAGEKIAAIGTSVKKNQADPFQIHFTSATAFPGLINSHDHLDFNCFSILGQKKYSNYTEWGTHIHKIFKDQIDTVLKIPKNLRTGWGIYKNLLAGVTTVVNHGSRLKIDDPVITVYQEPQNLHSLKFEKGWQWKLNNPLLKNKDCVIHTGEGSDKQSSIEIDRLLKFNFFRRNLIGVHGVAMNATQAKKFKGLVWCPESNRVLLNKHARIADLKGHTPLLFGTDSTLTGNWNIWHHLRLARSLHQVNDAELFEMITRSPARLWGLNSGELQSDKDADLVIVKKKTGIPTWDDVFKTNPEDILLIIHKGSIKMFDKAMHVQLAGLPLNTQRFSRVNIKGHLKFVEGDLPGLITNIKKYNSGVQFPVEAIDTISTAAYL